MFPYKMFITLADQYAVCLRFNLFFIARLVVPNLFCAFDAQFESFIALVLHLTHLMLNVYDYSLAFYRYLCNQVLVFVSVSFEGWKLPLCDNVCSDNKFGYRTLCFCYLLPTGLWARFLEIDTSYLKDANSQLQKIFFLTERRDGTCGCSVITS